MHFGYGTGFLLGVFRHARGWGRMRDEPTPLPEDPAPWARDGADAPDSPDGARDDGQ